MSSLSAAATTAGTIALATPAADKGVTSNPLDDSVDRSSSSVGICCFFMKYGICDPPRPPCRFRHGVIDDGITPCCFGGTCRLGHKRRVLSANCTTVKDTKEYWDKYNNSNGNGLVGISPAERDAKLLRSQLEPWSTAVLRRRLVDNFGEDHRLLDPWSRADLMNRLLEHYAAMGTTRNVIQVDGMPVDDELLAEISKELHLWRNRHGAVNSRPSINATSYMILRSPKEFGTKASKKAQQAAKKLAQNQHLWHLAEKAIQQVGDSEFADNFSALAVTYGFQGSPHIDKQNTGPFYGLSLGDFPDGQGGICVEAAHDTIAQVNTKNRLGKVDGRYPHWVSEYDKGCERYSLIYYSTWHDYQHPGKAYFGECKTKI